MSKTINLNAFDPVSPDEFNLDEEENVKDKQVEEEVEEETEETTEVQDEEEQEEEISQESESPDVTLSFLEAYFEENGWELEDTEKEIYTSNGGGMKGLRAVMNTIIDSVAESKLASEEVAQLNEYVKNGGTVKEFYEKAYSSDLPDFKSLDMEDVNNQQWVLYQYYLATSSEQNQALREKTAKRLVKAAISEGELEAEALEAQEKWVNYQKNQKIQLVEQQKKQKEEEYQQERRAIEEAKSFIKSSTEKELGIQLTNVEKVKLIEFLYDVDPKSGKTKYQEKLEKDPSMGLKIAAMVFTGITDGKLPKRVEKDVASKFQKQLEKTPVFSKRNPPITKNEDKGPNLKAFDA